MVEKQNRFSEGIRSRSSNPDYCTPLVICAGRYFDSNSYFGT